MRSLLAYLLISLLCACGSGKTINQDRLVRDFESKIHRESSLPEPTMLPPRKPNSVGSVVANFGINASTCVSTNGGYGVYIVGFYKNSPAQIGGLVVGDRVIKFANKAVITASDLTLAIKQFPPNDAAAISIIRDRNIILDIFVIGNSRENTPPSQQTISQNLCYTLGLRSP